MTQAEFEAAFPTESDFVERKTGVGHQPLGESIAAFSNTDGGVILIGVTDQGEVKGKDPTQGLQDKIHRIVGTIHDPGKYAIYPFRVCGTPVTVISVAKRSGGFAQTSSGRILVRRGTMEIPLFGAELRQFISTRSLEKADSTDTGIPFENADPELVAAVIEAFDWTESSASTRFEEIGLVGRDGEGSRLTMAGALHLLKRPGDKLGKTYIEVLRYRDESSNYDRRVEFAGPLREQVERATEFVSDEIGEEVVVLGVHRHELSRIPQRVIREAVANAVAHRDYQQHGRCVRIEIRPDTVQVISPGGLPEPVTVENMRDQTASRNPSVIRVLRKFNLAEDTGAGIDIMEDLMREQLLDPPVFEDTGSEVRVTLPIRSAVAPDERAWVIEVEQRGIIEPADRILLVHAARKESLTNSRARELLRVDADQARIALQRLRDAGFLVQQGTRGGATYSLDHSLAPPAGLRLEAPELEDLVVAMAEDGPITNALVRSSTGLDRSKTMGLLHKLVQEGRLVRVGERRGTRYLSVASEQDEALF
ncbi:MAG: putative DNA binding domain-containing protein [Actinobacteria bacterium]|nr:putative DNA binding domain-containing protein [Actinomycetota bacterium]